MDNKDVYLKIIINYNGQEFSKTVIEFISLEELKKLIMKEYNILESDYQYIKLNYKNKTNNKSFLIENDYDIITNAEEIDEYNYMIRLELILDNPKEIKNINTEKENKEPIEQMSDIKNVFIIKNAKSMNNEISKEIKFFYQGNKKEEDIITPYKIERNDFDQEKEIKLKKKLEEIKNKKNLINKKLDDIFKKNFESLKNNIISSINNNGNPIDNKDNNIKGNNLNDILANIQKLKENIKMNKLGKNIENDNLNKTVREILKKEREGKYNLQKFGDTPMSAKNSNLHFINSINT